jgi:hypothetical protein
VCTAPIVFLEDGGMFIACMGGRRKREKSAAIADRRMVARDHALCTEDSRPVQSESLSQNCSGQVRVRLVTESLTGLGVSSWHRKPEGDELDIAL